MLSKQGLQEKEGENRYKSESMMPGYRFVFTMPVMMWYLIDRNNLSIPEGIL